MAALLACCAPAEKIDVDLAPDALIKSRLESGAVSTQRREAAIQQLFADAGCTSEQQRVDRSSGNVICTLPGRTPSTIVVGGHFDFIERGQGIVDDWSGTALLPSLYQALKNRPRQHTYVFVAFAAEERGLVGSARYVKQLTASQKALIHAFVNLECLGLTPVKVWTKRSTPELTTYLSQVAQALDIKLQGVNVDLIGDDDTRSFLPSKIPVISIHSVTQETFSILHSKRDTVDAIHFDDYYTAYKLAAYYLAFLDVRLE